MFASLLRYQEDHPRSERTPLLAAFHNYRNRHGDDDQSDVEQDDHAHHGDIPQFDGEDDRDVHQKHRRGDGPLLPVFSELLDQVPIYSTTHAIRTIVVQRCETTLSWDQLRSPQVSQFLVKPIQQQILSEHFSRGTLYCLLANCLQFRKESEAYPGNSGVSRSRALICELLATRLLKEFSTRELIDALSYDFDPLQGMTSPAAGTITPGAFRPHSSPRSARVSMLEVAIRAQAKKFLAHPLVVQHLEAIWAGTIVFHSSADSLHRHGVPEPLARSRYYSTLGREVSPERHSSRVQQSAKQTTGDQTPVFPVVRRTVTLYDPYDASWFKLSRLRVPRYRQLFSTMSFGIMLGLFLAVLFEKSEDITGLEVLFWFWSAGYMLDEIVGFSEQGFGLYIMSVWNAFDLGILLLFVVYYILRLYGILMPDVPKSDIASMAYDVLGSSAVLLFPRLFSVLDHSRYFSQLLIAFRLMAMDLVAILVLIVIACSGFFVAFTLSFSKDLDAPSAAYALFQMVMGFTPAAWEIWGDYNPLGKTLLTLFLFICHFLIVTILITVLTNSFMAIVQNANEEHQFLFAVNTISMVKSDALFSYIPPTNILGWLVIPLKYCMSFPRFIKMNRTMIKVTHMPVLFSIFFYERLLLSNLEYGPTDLVEQRGRSRAKVSAFSIRAPVDVFSPGTRLREPSITTFRKDRALEEVFRRPFNGPTISALPDTLAGRRKSSNAVRDWMKGMGTAGVASPPQEETQSVLDRLELRRPRMRRTKTAPSDYQHWRNPLATIRPVASDLENGFLLDRPIPIAEEDDGPDMSMDDIPQETDADGDDELVTNDEYETTTSDHFTAKLNSDSDKENRHDVGYESSENEYFRTPMTMKARTPALGTPFSTSLYQRQYDSTSTPRPQPPSQSKPVHTRNLSSSTVLFSPSKDAEKISRSKSPTRPTRTPSGTGFQGRFMGNGDITPQRPAAPNTRPSQPRAIMPPRDATRSTPQLANLNFFSLDARRQASSFNARALDLASDLGDNRHGPDFGTLGALPASFNSQLEMAVRVKGHREEHDTNRMSRIMLARMTTLEQSFRDVLKEVKGLRKGSDDGGLSRQSSKRNSAYTDLGYSVKRQGKETRPSGEEEEGVEEVD
ncbi:hypothetical protein GQ43DRAFT_441895 [Delitschia confertaspora ATCC 74209]|uniref:Ion transport domain-containing protein n=1 Tax=Delitschia confertaspora ATCC 74209 TaxID=1513339 RepID=A0A9P4JP88_9PLEO|nr:hypothetical protein GQ43DRAFT_441895 [Delitschia confertaspora ATCC 74209]